MEYHLDKNFWNSDERRVEKMRNGAGIGMCELGKEKEDMVVLGADTAGSARAKYFADEFPERFVQVGVAEQNLIGTTAGFAYYGKVPYAVTYAAFLVGRAWEPMRTTLCYPNNHAVLVSSHAGLATGPDGPTHQMTEDISIMRCLPNVTVIAPLDYEQARKAVKAAYDCEGVVYVRNVREATPVVTTEETPFEVGKAQVLREGSDITAVGHGHMVATLLEVAEELKDEVSIEVINMHTIKPFDTETLTNSAKKTGKVFTAEDHNIVGALGGAVSETLAEECPVPVHRHGVKDRFAESGSWEELAKKYKLDVAGTKEALKEFVSSS